MTAVRVRVEADMSGVEQALERIRASFPDVAAAAVLTAGQTIEGEAKARCPVDMGTLRASITTELKDAAAPGDPIIATIGTNIEYAPYVHQGTGLYARDGNGRKAVPWWYKDAKGKWHTTSGQHPQPFLRDAAEAKRAEIQATLIRLIRAMGGTP